MIYGSFRRSWSNCGSQAKHVIRALWRSLFQTWGHPWCSEAENHLQSPGRLRLTDLAQSEIVHDFSDFFPSFPTRSVWKSCILPDMQSICRAKCRANSEQIPAVEVVMVMCFEDALSDDNMMKLDWNYLGWALGLFLTRDVWKFMTASPWWPAAMFPTSFAGSSLNCAERASVKILKFQFQQIQKPPSSSFLIKSSQVRSWAKKSFLPTLRCRSLQLHEIARFEMFWACLNSWHCFRIEQFLQTP